MSNTLTDISSNDIITHIEQNFSHAQATGLNCLIFLSMREQTTVAFQHEELGFKDIPQQIVTWCDGLDVDDLLELATRITAGLLDDLLETGTQVLTDLLEEVTAAALNTKSAQNVTVHPIDNQD